MKQNPDIGPVLAAALYSILLPNKISFWTGHKYPTGKYKTGLDYTERQECGTPLQAGYYERNHKSTKHLTYVNVKFLLLDEESESLVPGGTVWAPLHLRDSSRLIHSHHTIRVHFSASLAFVLWTVHLVCLWWHWRRRGITNEQKVDCSVHIHLYSVKMELWPRGVEYCIPLDNLQ